MPPTQIAVAVVVDEGRVLVGRRSQAAVDAAGMDEFPGGKVEPGETLPAAAARECAEETGLIVEVLEPIDSAMAPASTGPVEIVFFLARPRSPTPEPRQPYAWISVSHLSQLRFPAANARVLAWLSGHHGGS